LRDHTLCYQIRNFLPGITIAPTKGAQAIFDETERLLATTD
jgi:hypothetical protein